MTSTPKQHAWFFVCEIAMRKSVKCSVENFRHSKKLTGGPEGGLGLDWEQLEGNVSHTQRLNNISQGQD